MHEQAEERRRIGREIHDSTAQSLVALGLTLGQLRRTCPTDAYPIFDEMRQLLAQAQREIRLISYLIHPPALGKLTISEALLALVEGFGRRTGLDIRFDLVDVPRICSPTAEEALYRVVQEALSNVHRHSQARHVTVRLSQGKAVTHVVIADDGVGIPILARPGVGLPGMHARLTELGGRLSIRRRSPGTAVIASVPLDRATA
jgi:two-component system NarL family sensor kinase